ncbi:MAG: alkaline phosphatase family protein [Longimicrobiales bacterium]
MRRFLALSRGGVALGLSALLVLPGRAAADPEPLRGAVSEHVIVVSIDGLRPDAIAAFGARTLGRLIGEGAYSLSASTILPSKTLPSHVSMLTGVPPESHGVTWNTDRTDEHGHVDVETIFERAHEAGLHTAAFFSKSKFQHLQKAGTLDYTQAPSGLSHWMATRTVGDAVTYLKHEEPNLLFVHIGEPDYAGHTVGWMSRVYGVAVRRADAALGKLIEAADDAFGVGEYTLIVTADHGGHGRNHGSEDVRDTTIPWIVWGEGVASGTKLGAGIRTMDTAATAVWLLGLEPAPDWIGRPVATAFTSTARFAAAAATRLPVTAATPATPDLLLTPILAGTQPAEAPRAASTVAGGGS